MAFMSLGPAISSKVETARKLHAIRRATNRRNDYLVSLAAFRAEGCFPGIEPSHACTSPTLHAGAAPFGGQQSIQSLQQPSQGKAPSPTPRLSRNLGKKNCLFADQHRNHGSKSCGHLSELLDRGGNRQPPHRLSRFDAGTRCNDMHLCALVRQSIRRLIHHSCM